MTERNIEIVYQHGTNDNLTNLFEAIFEAATLLYNNDSKVDKNAA